MRERATVLAIATAKGGVGKTALAVNLASSFALGERVVLVDLDVQADCTSGLGIRRDDARNDDGSNLFAALTAGSELRTIDTRWVDQYSDNPMVFERERLRLVPGGEVMSGFLPWAVRNDGEDNELDAALEPLRASADWIILDCPPTDEWTQRQALRAADWLLVPISDDFDEMRGLDRIMRIGVASSGVRLLGAVLARMPAGARTALRETRETAEEILGGAATVLSPFVRESVEFGRAKEMGLAVNEYSKWLVGSSGWSSSKAASRLAYDYDLLTDSIRRELAVRGGR